MGLTVIRVQRQDGDTRSLDREIAAEGGIELGHLVDDAFSRHSVGHVAQRHVAGQCSHAHLVADKDVEAFLVFGDAALDKLLITREVEAVDVHVLLVHRCHDEHVEQSVLEIGYGTVETLDGSATGILRRHAQVDLHVFIEDRQQVEASILGLGGLGDNAERVAGKTKGIAMVGCYLGRAVDNGGTDIKHGRRAESLEDKFIADTVCITVGQCHTYFLIVHI